ATTRPTTHDDPVYECHGVIHYGVTNVPGAVPHTSTYALTNATLPYVLAVAERGVRGAMEHDPALRPGVMTVGGRVTNPVVAEALGVDAADPFECLG
ncbi:MAG: alanine dehydrogenase, partial [Acidimicrobiales bacterium]